MSPATSVVSRRLAPSGQTDALSIRLWPPDDAVRVGPDRQGSSRKSTSNLKRLSSMRRSNLRIPPHHSLTSRRSLSRELADSNLDSSRKVVQQLRKPRGFRKHTLRYLGRSARQWCRPACRHVPADAGEGERSSWDTLATKLRRTPPVFQVTATLVEHAPSCTNLVARISTPSSIPRGKTPDRAVDPAQRLGLAPEMKAPAPRPATIATAAAISAFRTMSL
jgi:hypothetical protein